MKTTITEIITASPSHRARLLASIEVAAILEERKHRRNCKGRPFGPYPETNASAYRGLAYQIGGPAFVEGEHTSEGIFAGTTEHGLLFRNMHAGTSTVPFASAGRIERITAEEWQRRIEAKNASMSYFYEHILSPHRID